MIAYNRQWLENLLIKDASKEAFENGCISEAEYRNLLAAHPVPFYTTNFFLRIGMFILTVVCTSFLMGLLMMMFASGISNSYGMIIFINGIICYGLLWHFTNKKHHYNSGVDDALLWMSAISICSAIVILSNAGNMGISLTIFLISLFFTLRYTDRLMAAFSFGSLVSFIFFSCQYSGGLVKQLLPFIIMISGIIIYITTKRIQSKKDSILYSGCLLVFEILSLACIYLAGNYFVVRELSNIMFDLHLQEGESIPFGYIFKFLTAAIPLIYVLAGIKSRDIVMIRVGLITVAASILTVKYYTHLLNIEDAMAIAGIFMVLVSAYLIRFLKNENHGYTSLKIGMRSKLIPQAESLVIAETFQGTGEIPANHTEFGGGSFGGAGAGEKF